MTYLGQTELAAVRARDAESGATWFTGPASFTAQGARDRRALLAEVDRLTLLVRQKHGELVMAGVDPLPHPTRDWHPMELLKNASAADEAGQQYTAEAFRAFAALLQESRGRHG